MPYKRKGSKYYQIELTPEGYPHKIRRSTGLTSKRKASQVEDTIRRLAADGQHEVLDLIREGEISPTNVHGAYRNGTLSDLIQRLNDPLLKDALEEFVAMKGGEVDDKRKNRSRHMRDKLFQVAPQDARLSWLADLDNAQAFVDYYREEEYASGTERRELDELSGFMRRYLGKQVRDEVFEGLQMRSDDAKRTRWLAEDEIKRVKRYATQVDAPYPVWTMICLSLSTGIRRGEMLDLRVRDLDMEDGAVVIPEGKSDAAERRIPLWGAAYDLVESWLEEANLGSADRVFPGLTGAKVQYWWRDVVADLAGVRDCPWHGLRHTFAVHSARNGMPLNDLRILLGHSSISTTQRYAIYQSNSLRRELHARAVQRMGLSNDHTSEHTHEVGESEKTGATGSLEISLRASSAPLRVPSIQPPVVAAM